MAIKRFHPARNARGVFETVRNSFNAIKAMSNVVFKAIVGIMVMMIRDAIVLF